VRLPHMKSENIKFSTMKNFFDITQVCMYNGQHTSLNFKVMKRDIVYS